MEFIVGLVIVALLVGLAAVFIIEYIGN